MCLLVLSRWNLSAALDRTSHFGKAIALMCVNVGISGSWYISISLS